MTTPTPKTTNYDFSADRLDLSRLVGYEITLFSDQFPGVDIQTKVLAVAERHLHVEGGRRFSRLENLVNNQQVVVQFDYGGQRVSLRATFARTAGGRCQLTLGDRITPLSQRRFCRVNMSTLVRLAVYPVTGFRRKRLSDLRWIETQSLNFSSGGLMVILPSPVEKGASLLMNVLPDDVSFPALVLGRVCHCFQAEDLQYRVGVEFITSETAKKMIPAARRRDLPPVLFSYDNAGRESLNKLILRRAKPGQGKS